MKKAGNTPPIQIKSSFTLPPSLLDFHSPIDHMFHRGVRGTFRHHRYNRLTTLMQPRQR